MTLTPWSDSMPDPQPARDTTLKSFGALTVKDAAMGEVEAVVATLNVVDKDRDVILPGAIANGAKVKLSAWGHDAVYGAMPVGKGHLEERGNQLVFKGNYFLTARHGADAFATVKELGADAEWSFGFKIVERSDPPEQWRGQGARQMLVKLSAFEVSPVLVGAGIGTQTVGVKDRATPPLADAPADFAADLIREARTALDARIPNAPLLKDDLPFLLHACRLLSLPVDCLPVVGVVKALGDARTRGQYHVAAHQVLVRGDLPTGDFRRVLAHELCHAKQALDGFEGDKAKAEELYGQLGPEYLGAEEAEFQAKGFAEYAVATFCGHIARLW